MNFGTLVDIKSSPEFKQVLQSKLKDYPCKIFCPYPIPKHVQKYPDWQNLCGLAKAITRLKIKMNHFCINQVFFSYYIFINLYCFYECLLFTNLYITFEKGKAKLYKFKNHMPKHCAPRGCLFSNILHGPNSQRICLSSCPLLASVLAVERATQLLHCMQKKVMYQF